MMQYIYSDLICPNILISYIAPETTSEFSAARAETGLGLGPTAYRLILVGLYNLQVTRCTRLGISSLFILNKNMNP